MAVAVVTGAGGFIGSAIAEALTNQGTQVIAVDCLTDYYNPDIKERRLSQLSDKGVDVRKVDLLNTDLPRLLDGVDYVFHQAGQPGVRPSWGMNFAQYSRNNVELTQRLLEAAAKNTVLKKFVYASSSSVYGNAVSYPVSEQSLPGPMSPYGVTKLAAEHLCGLYAANYGMPCVSLRYFTVYGPGQRPDMAFSKFISAIKSGRTISVYGDGEQIRDFTFISDVVSANLAASISDLRPGAVLNVCGGGSVTVNETLAILERISGTRVSVNRGEPIPGDVRRTGGDNTLMRSLTGWVPKVSIEEGLQRQFEVST